MKTALKNQAVFHQAFVDSLPVLMGYSTMGFVAGVLLAAKGNVILSPLWAFHIAGSATPPTMRRPARNG